jgi:uncharacterized protein (DUF1499 family)
MLNFKSVLRGLTENTAEISTEFSISPEEAAERITSWVQSKSIWKVESQSTADETVTMHLTRTTRLFGFVDDVHITLQASDSGGTMNAKSESRVGKGDLGQNPRNLSELAAAVRESSP